MLLICSNGLSKASKKVFKATPHSLIPFSSARAARTEHHDPSSATDQGQNLEISQVFKANNGLNIQSCSGGDTATSEEHFFFSISCELKLSHDEDCFLQIMGLTRVVHF